VCSSWPPQRIDVIAFVERLPEITSFLAWDVLRGRVQVLFVDVTQGDDIFGAHFGLSRSPAPPTPICQVELFVGETCFGFWSCAREPVSAVVPAMAVE